MPDGHFNRGQRAFFFALGYLGWLLGPLPLVLTTTGVVIVMWRRQFRRNRAKRSKPIPDRRIIQAIPISTATR